MGKGAYIRIQNKSTYAVSVSVDDRVQVDTVGMDAIQGILEPGASLPSEGVEQFGNGHRYQYIEGEKGFFLQKDGSFKLSVNTEGSSSGFVMLHVGSSDWWSGESGLGDHVMVAADVEECGDDVRIEVRIFNAINTKSWMGDLADKISGKALCCVGLPGTHDSGTFTFDERLGASADSDLTMNIQKTLEGDGGSRGILGSIGSVISGQILGTVYSSLCKTQHKSIKEQLEGGIRYLDLRIVYHEDSGRFFTCHGVFCADAKTVFDEINEFLNENKKEIVLLDINHLHKMDGHNDKFVKQVFATLGDKIAAFPKLKPSSTVGAFWEANAQAVLLYCNAETVEKYHRRLWSQNQISSPWPNTTDINALHEKLKENVEKRNKDKFFVLQGLLTPDGNLIKDEILSNNVNTSLETIAKRVSCKVVDWVEDEWYEQTQNVVIVDFFEQCSMVPSIINWNRK